MQFEDGKIMSLKVISLFLLLLFSWLIQANDEEVRAENNKDLRSNEELYRVENKAAKKILILEKTLSHDYNLLSVEGDKTERLKINRNEAQKLDSEFSSLFIDMQLEQMEIKNCSSDWSLTLRSEKSEWCSKDEKKTQSLKNFWDGLIKLF
jgi:hypothetical protein